MDGREKAIARAAAFTSKAARAIAAFGIAGLICVAVMAITDGVLRAFFNAPIDGMGEVSRLVILVSLASFFPLALAERHDITIRFLGNFLGGPMRAGMEAFGAALTLAFFALLVWRIGYQALDTQSSGETTWMLRWPVAPWWALATVILVLCLPVQMVVLWRLLRGKEAPEHRSGTEI